MMTLFLVLMVMTMMTVVEWIVGNAYRRLMSLDIIITMISAKTSVIFMKLLLLLSGVDNYVGNSCMMVEKGGLTAFDRFYCRTLNPLKLAWPESPHF